jgi:hypothetical protein
MELRTDETMLIYLPILLIFSGCSAFQKKGSWGKDAFSPVKASRVGAAFKKNITSAHVWAPLGGALAIHWGGHDHKISNWAQKEKNIYGDRTAADNWSDNFDDILKYEMFLTPLLTASSEEGTLREYVWRKGKGYVVIAGASRLPDYAHDRLAKAIHRRRPNKSDTRSFPSGHSTQAGTRNMIVLRNLQGIPMNPNVRFGIETLNTTMSAGVLWARVEGKRHYPSDVLAGYALGAFLSGFIYDSLMYSDPEHPESVAVIPAGDKWTLQYTYAF